MFNNWDPRDLACDAGQEYHIAVPKKYFIITPMNQKQRGREEVTSGPQLY